MSIETIKELNKAVKHIEELQREKNQLFEIYNGLFETSITFYYVDAHKEKNLINTFGLKFFPFNLKKEIKILILDALDQYDEKINELKLKFLNDTEFLNQ